MGTGSHVALETATAVGCGLVAQGALGTKPIDRAVQAVGNVTQHADPCVVVGLDVDQLVALGTCGTVAHGLT